MGETDENSTSKEQKVSKPYDKGYKDIFSVRKNFLDFLKKYIALEWTKELSEDCLEEVDKEFVGADFEGYESDIIYKITLQDSGDSIYMFIIQEMQSKVDYTMPFRMLTYMHMLWVREFKNMKEPNRAGFRLPAILPCVLYNGRNRWTAKRSYREVVEHSDLLEEYALDFKYILVDVDRLEKEFIRKDNTVIDNVLYFDNLKEADNAEERIKEISVRLSHLDYDEQKQFTNWMRLIITHEVDRETANNVVERFEKGDVKAMSSGLSILIGNAKNEGRKEGMKEGRKEGMEKGMKEGREEANLRTAQALFLEGISSVIIVKATGLPEKKVEEIRQKMVNEGKIKE